MEDPQSATDGGEGSGVGSSSQDCSWKFVSWFGVSVRIRLIESGQLHDEVPQKLFSFLLLQQVILKNNRFSGGLDLGNNISTQLKTLNFQNNSLTSVELSSIYYYDNNLCGSCDCPRAIRHTRSGRASPRNPGRLAGDLLQEEEGALQEGGGAVGTLQCRGRAHHLLRYGQAL